ncbi:MAG: mandelate racemase/muconate lactonizing enzyme family protein [Halodesulfurarchaeum sp.]|nr:mandelate racemase/muconate lactonizing enzyme family protein [Halodesulfurarchaeum sp.]
MVRGDTGSVEVTGIETAVLPANVDWNLVKVRTDVGTVGVGEAYRGGGITDIIEYMERFLVGENPLDVERLFRLLVQETSGHGGTTGKAVTAVSGIEIALWDAAGKILDVPVYQLLGGKYRNSIRVYADAHAGAALEVEDGSQSYHNPETYSPDAYAQTAQQVLEEGFTALKFDLDIPMDNEPDPYNGRLDNESLGKKVDIVKRVRETVGPSVDLAFDSHWDYSLDSAKRLARSLEPYDLMWLEDVIPPENMAAQREVTRTTSTPIAAGENRYRVHEFRELLYEFGVDVITPDPTACGGLAESKAIANRAEENYIVFSPHNVCSPIGTMALVHLGAAVPNFGVLEFHARDIPWWDDLLVRSNPLVRDGYIEVPDGPGLGIKLDSDEVAAHATDNTAGF